MRNIIENWSSTIESVKYFLWNVSLDTFFGWLIFSKLFMCNGLIVSVIWNYCRSDRKHLTQSRRIGSTSESLSWNNINHIVPNQMNPIRKEEFVNFSIRNLTNMCCCSLEKVDFNIVTSLGMTIRLLTVVFLQITIIFVNIMY